MYTFKYAIKDNLIPLVRETIVNYGSDYLTGYMEEGMESDVQLRHCSLYLACELLHPTPNMTVHQNPLAIVARNDIEAVRIFYEVTKLENGTTLCELEPRCDSGYLHVEAVD